MTKEAKAALDRRAFLKTAGALIVSFSMHESGAQAQFGSAAIPGSPDSRQTDALARCWRRWKHYCLQRERRNRPGHLDSTAAAGSGRVAGSIRARTAHLLGHSADARPGVYIRQPVAPGEFPARQSGARLRYRERNLIQPGCAETRRSGGSDCGFEWCDHCR